MTPISPRLHHNPACEEANSRSHSRRDLPNCQRREFGGCGRGWWGWGGFRGMEMRYLQGRQGSGWNFHAQIYGLTARRTAVNQPRPAHTHTHTHSLLWCHCNNPPFLKKLLLNCVLLTRVCVGPLGLPGNVYVPCRGTPLTGTIPTAVLQGVPHLCAGLSLNTIRA